MIESNIHPTPGTTQDQHSGNAEGASNFGKAKFSSLDGEITDLEALDPNQFANAGTFAQSFTEATQTNTCSDCKPKTKTNGRLSCFKVMFENIMALALGGVFGFALDKAKTNVPYVISMQMRMDIFVMMRMFLAASATSIAVVAGLDFFGLKERCSKPGVSLGYRLFGGFGGNLIGGFLLGVGMYFTGSCPGTIWAQIGAGYPYVGGVLAGGILGAITFGYLDTHIRKSNPDFHSSKKHDFVETKKGYFIASLLSLSVFAGAIAFFNHFFPWNVQINDRVLVEPISSTWFLDPTATSWDPMVAGVLLGLLQIPAMLSSGGGLGQSSGWCMLAGFIAEVFDPNLKETSPYLKKHQTDRKAAFQIVMALGIIGGAALSQFLGNYPAMRSPADDGCGGVLRAFFGGYLLLLGSRLGGGCTSGHGLTGIATLSFGSLLSVVGMFAGGMSVAFLF